MSSDCPEVRKVLSALAPKIRDCKRHLKAQHVGNALYGLKNMNSGCSEVRAVLSALTEKIHDCKIDLTAQNIGNALYGLQGMSSDSLEVRAILSALAIKIRSCKEDFNEQEVANALYGLQNMSSNCSEVRDVLSALVMKVYECKDDMNDQAVGNALYGLRSMSSDCSEVRTVLSALAMKIRNCKGNLSAQAVGNALYGLQAMNSDCSEVQDLLSALAIQIHKCKEELTVQQVSNSFYGLQGIISVGAISDFVSVVSFLHRQVSLIVESLRSNDLSRKGSPGYKIGTTELVTLCQSLTLFLPEIFEYHDVKAFKDLDKLNNLISAELRSRRGDGDRYYQSLGFQSNPEMRMHEIAMKVLQDTVIKADKNIQLFDLFESDIVLCIPSDGGDKKLGNEIIINIEVDGVHHNHEKKKLFCERKDKYLKTKGVYISRIDVSTIVKMTDIEIELWVLKVISLSGLAVR
jgi:hypothetical protein